MSLAEDLLNTLSDDSASDGTETNDVEEPIIVDETRKIIVPNKLKTIAVTGDKDVETVTFNCIRYWDTVHDLSNFVIYINYILPNNDTGTYIPTIKDRYDDYFTFDWVIGREITKYNGKLQFIIVARKVDSDGVLKYQWSSLLNSECTIAQGLDIINVTDDEETEDRLSLLLQLPLENGMSANSIQQEHCVAGLKGFYWSGIDMGNKRVTLSTKNDDFGVGQDFNVSDFWAVGDIISIHSDKKWENCSTITAINGKQITVNSLPFPYPTGESGHITDQAVYVLAKPDKGLCDFGQNSVAFGESCKSINYDTFTAGRACEAYGQYGVALGRDNRSAYACLSAGRGSHAQGMMSTSLGNSCWSEGERAFSEGMCSSASGDDSVAMGRRALWSANGDADEETSGRWNTAAGEGSVALGIGNLASAQGAVAVGKHVDATAEGSVAMGTQIKNSDGTFVRTKSTGIGSAAIGQGVRAIMANDFVCGKNNEAGADCCFIGGRNNKIIFNGHNSFIHGDSNTIGVTGKNEVNQYNGIIGYQNTISGGHSATMLFGRGHKSTRSGQALTGLYSNPSSNTLFAVGNGSASTPSNAFEVLFNGSAYAGGDKLATEAYVDDELAKFDFIKVVDILPETGLPNKIYFVPKADNQNQDLFDEYIWVNEAWEWVTTKQLEVDLTPYAKVEQLDSKLDKLAAASGYNLVYIKRMDGSEDGVPFTASPVVHTLMSRDSNGNTAVAYPTHENHAVNMKYVVEYLPLERGISENSVQQEGNIATGGKAFKFSKVDATNKKFTLVHADGSKVSIDEVGYEVGDEYSFIFVHQYDTANGDSETYKANCKADFVGKITSVQTETDGSVTVAVDTLHYTVKDDAVITDDYADYCLFFVPTKPTIGDIEIGQNAVTTGINNTNVGYASLVGGEGNINSGMYVLMGGKYNKGGYGGLIGGRDNDGSANYVTVGGTNNKVLANRGTAFNLANEVLHENGTCVGEHNKTSAPDQLVGGKYANPSPEAILSMGNGTSDEERANAFEVVVIDGVAYLRLNSTDLAIKNNCLYFRGNKVTATHATALGLDTEAGSGALANGRNSKAQGFCTTGMGDGIVITSAHVKGTASFGAFNDYSDTNVIFMIGDGTSDTDRHNAFEVLKDGGIKIGNTTLTETQLQKVLAFIETIEG